MGDIENFEMIMIIIDIRQNLLIIDIFRYDIDHTHIIVNKL